MGVPTVAVPTLSPPKHPHRPCHPNLPRATLTSPEARLPELISPPETTPNTSVPTCSLAQARSTQLGSVLRAAAPASVQHRMGWGHSFQLSLVSPP